MASEPINEQIANHLVDTLKGIRRAAGYFEDIGAAVRREMPNNDMGHMEIVLIGETPETVETQMCGNPGPIVYHQTFAAFVGIFPNDAEADAVCVERTGNRIWADITRAVHRDINRGGIADDTWTQPVIYGVDFVIVPIVVMFRCRGDDPTKRV